MSWKHPGSLTLLTLCVAACGSPAGNESLDARDSALETPATQQTPASVEEAPTVPVTGVTEPEPVAGHVPESGPIREPRTLVVPKHYATIQEAINAAEPGDTVYVAPGVYSEHVVLKSGIKLLGAGALITLWDGQGEPLSLIDFSGASDVEISGFTFRNVGTTTWCTMTNDLYRWCGGDWYAAAIFADGHEPETSARVTQNIFEGNDTGVLLYFHAVAEVRNNVFWKNGHALAFNHLQDTGSVDGNIFWGNAALGIGVQAGYVDIQRNIIAGSSVGLAHMWVQTGDIRCNVFFQNEQDAVETFDVPPRVVMGENGNVVLDPLFEDPDAGDFRLRAGSPLKHAKCFDHRMDDLGLTAEP
ncbi:right-handed parallel beta-helix repeat-containing protein [Pyxidicoccus parkwayensis]|uniref:Right-handed parallel beta-helix repeat-containing protein n=1 Tax=Pyxidicoccus parkwayensis TaxID=2813578 RepID=A0ABX7P665_9BACT|nr:NosD domain-containing protein [Pyxidicoccus parkwaysis]QSQ25920.1 right-handed parallel beta-helix repeat-containing protein [Pyxidicoccus parkwaysis]